MSRREDPDARAQGGSLDAELQMKLISGGGGWFGVATVRTADGTSYTSDVDPEGDQPTVDGSTIAYAGTFSSDAGDFEGSMSFPCP